MTFAELLTGLKHSARIIVIRISFCMIIEYQYFSGGVIIEYSFRWQDFAHLYKAYYFANFLTVIKYHH